MNGRGSAAARTMKQPSGSRNSPHSSGRRKLTGSIGNEKPRRRAQRSPLHVLKADHVYHFSSAIMFCIVHDGFVVNAVDMYFTSFEQGRRK
jgi:hypothetical protein